MNLIPITYSLLMKKISLFALFLLTFNFILNARSESLVTDNHENRISMQNSRIEQSMIIQLWTVANINNGRNAHDGVGIYMNEDYNNGFDSGDAPKPMNFAENLARVIDGIRASVEQKKLPVPGEVLPLFINGYSKTDYAFKTIFSGLDAYDTYIDDAFTGISHLATSGNYIYFSVSTPESKVSNRFSIRFERKANTFFYQNNVWSPQDPSGIAQSTDNIFVVNNAATLSASTQVNDIRIAQSATLNVKKVLTIQGNLTIDGDLVFKSTPTGDGELGVVPPTSVITGNATVERYMKGIRSYRMVSSSVNTATSIHANWQEGAENSLDNPSPGFGTHITGSVTGANGFDATQTGNPSMFTLNHLTQNWVAIGNTDGNRLNAGFPYLLLVRGDRSIDLNNNSSTGSTTLRAKGTLLSGNLQQNFASAPAGSFLMFGNPYQSTVDVNTLLATASNISQSYYYVFDPTIADQGGYVTVALPDGINNNAGSQANQFLQPGQAAQVSTLAAGAAAITFMESYKTPGNHTSTSAHRSGLHDRLSIQLYTSENFASNKKPHDGAVILFDTAYSNEVTPDDAKKPMNFQENIALDNGGRYLSIEKRNMPVASEVFHLYTNGYTTSDYTFQIMLSGLENETFYLEDNYTGRSLLLSDEENTYRFTIDENPMSKATDRFFIRVESSLGITTQSFSESRLYPNPLNSQVLYIYLPNLTSEQVKVTVSDLSGRTILNSDFKTRDNRVTVDFKDEMAAGIYLVTLHRNGRKETFRLIKE